MKVRSAAREAPGRTAGVLGTVVVHAAAAFFLFSVVKTPPPSPPVYAVNLVAAPAPAPKQRLAPEATPSPPAPEPPAPAKTTPKVPVKKVPVPPKKEQIEPTPRRDPTPKTSAPETPAPGETPSTGRDATTVKTPGLDFPYPEYLRNVENQIYRRWARPTGNVALRAEISFLITRDGTVRAIQFVTRSGNFSYDLEAQGAIEAAANAHAFGPLPDGWQADVLPISFYFEPRPQ
ncbi:MAG: TonB C-terminal domain-containing protein [Bacillota bacterium]|jgi:protein TonB